MSKRPLSILRCEFLTFIRNKIVTGSRDQTVRIWDARTYQCLKVIGAPPITSTAVTNPGPFTNVSQHYTVQGPGQLPFTSISPTMGHSGMSDMVARRVSSSEYHRASILCLQFDNEIMVTGSSDHTCIVWDVKNDYTPIRRLRGHRAGVLDVCFDHRYIVSCSKDTFLCVWDRKTGELLKRLTGHRGPVNAVQLRGDLVVSASGDGIAKLWNLTSGLCVKEFPSKDRGLACVEFSEDGRTILAGGNDQVIYQFDANTGELVTELRGHKNLVRSLHLDNSNGRVVSGSYDMSVKVFNFETGDMIIDFPGWTTSWMLAAKSDYRRIVATSQDSRAVIMDFGYGLDGVHMLES
jgi:F-box and WD-40 domain protein 1/11